MSGLHPYVTAGDPNIGRAFRIACGDITSNVVPLPAMASIITPVSKKRWDDLSARVVEIAGTSEIIPERLSFLIAGLDYGIYQFDVMMQAWDGASFLEPDALKGTLLATLVMDKDRNIRSGDFITGCGGWALGAWSHYLCTGDRPFLKVALEATLGAIDFYEGNEFDGKLNLFRGPAVLCDGISSYPEVWAKSMKGIGHIIKWPVHHPDKKSPIGLGLPMHALSTNCINYKAYLVAAQMQQELGLPVDTALLAKAERLKVAINKHFWREDAGTYRYLLDIFGGSDQQEGLGNSFAILFGIASPEQSSRIINNMHITPQGIPIKWPVYPRYASPDGTTFGNHNATIWPPVSGVWAAAAGRVDHFSLELKNAADRACRHNQFAEIYHPVTGEVYGGIQEGRTARGGAAIKTFMEARLGGSGEPTPENLEKLFPAVKGKEGINLWQACGRNTFSSTSYLRMVPHGLCGIKLETDGITFHPTVPTGMSPVAVYELPYRQVELEIHITGEGQKVRKMTINGKRKTSNRD